MILTFMRVSAVIAPPRPEAIDKLRRIVGRPPKIKSRVKIEMTTINGIKCEWMEHISAADCPLVMLYLHGGGYCMLSTATHRGLTSKFSKLAGIKVLAVDYRLAPEHPFPAALEDALAVYTWLIDPQGGGYRPQNVVIGGDSAGGGLTLATMLRARDQGLPLPSAIVCLSPWVDLECRGESWKKYKSYDYLSMPETFNCPQMYAGNHRLDHPLISPINASLVVGEVEVLRDEAVMLAEKAKTDGVDATLEIYTDMVHVFQAFGGLAAKSREALNSAVAFIHTHIGRTRRQSGPTSFTSITSTSTSSSLFVAVAAL
ncbi:alpha/beta hydrolase fold domain containing protein [Acanthamoeba castellanii str. Neff]|uniref:Alpha/beta hydrolase fold domain containing protein n=1 Tax=Acanthamoeba castellanii (strain ATCC 30010 / Neff) TaxID=1257118 RepID=L8GK87_ACACF|nr:alpha/beta hydrolase fold domain containing protein [Acanthamoeba castellanii str. Neff]ELR13452.1 alpha/beta hydrolase fold domain containing protein [Acanthamoeba castellanii str. Neff]